MTTTRTTYAGIDGVRQPVQGLDLRVRARTGTRQAALVAVTVAILFLVAL
jgi:hypothetical protein